MPSILQITDKGPGGGGVRRVVEDHARMLEEEGWKVRRLRLQRQDVGTADDSGDAIAPVGFAQGSATDAAAIAALRRAATGADLIHLHLGITSVTAAFVAEAAALAPLLVSVHDISPFPELSGYAEPMPLRARLARRWYSGLRKAVWDSVCTQAASIHVPSAYLSGLAIRAGAPVDQVEILPHAVFVDGIAGQPVVQTGPVLVHAGLLSRPKGAGHLLPVFALLADAQARLVVCGDGPMADALKNDIRRRGLWDRVTLTGRIGRKDVLRHMATARAVLQPSLIPEGFGLTVLEAMSLGRPVVGFASGATAEWIEHECTGLVVPPSSLAGFARALDRVLASPDLAARMGDAARRRAVSVCSPETVRPGLARLCGQAMQSRKVGV